MELHDAMQVYWSRFSHKTPWSMWVLSTALHESGSALGGIVFEDIGPSRRRAAALFNDSFIKDAPAGDPDPAAWAARSRFWTACHEMGTPSISPTPGRNRCARRGSRWRTSRPRSAS